MNHIFWLLPNLLAGRPGPNREPWNAPALRDAGIRVVMSVNDGAQCEPEEFAGLGIAYRCVPMPPNAPPLEGDAERCRAALLEAYDFVAPHIGRRVPTLVHCSSGKDRTGLFMAYYLIRELHLSPAAAMARVRAVRPIAFTAEGWEPFAAEVLNSMPEAP